MEVGRCICHWTDGEVGAGVQVGGGGQVVGKHRVTEGLLGVAGSETTRVSAWQEKCSADTVTVTPY